MGQILGLSLMLHLPIQATPGAMQVREFYLLKGIWAAMLLQLQATPGQLNMQEFEYFLYLTGTGPGRKTNDQFPSE